MGLSLDPIIDFQINIIKIVWQTVMRIVKEILGVKGLKANKQLIAAKKYIEWLPNTLDFNFYSKMTLLPTDLGISIRNFKNRFAPPQPHTNYFKRWFSYSIVLRCGTANLMICVLQFPLRALMHCSNFGVFCKNICHQFCDRCAEWIFPTIF